MAGINGAMLSALGPLLDFQLSRRVVYVDYEWTLRGYVLVASTCAFAVLSTYSRSTFLAKYHRVSYQVIGQMKTILVYGAGYYLFDSGVRRRCDAHRDVYRNHREYLVLSFVHIWWNEILRKAFFSLMKQICYSSICSQSSKYVTFNPNFCSL